MWATILLMALKGLVLFGLKKLQTMDNGLPKEVATTILDAVAVSQSNNAPQDLIDTVKAVL